MAQAYDLGIDFGPDSSEAYAGDSMEDFYQYLLTPRHHKSWGGSGAIRHFGPSRNASVRPQDAAMADLIMQQMAKDEERKYKAEAYESDLGRRQAADSLMAGRGEGAGGTMSFGGQTATIAPKAPLTPEQRMTVQAGGYEPDPVLVAESQGKGYPAGRGGGSPERTPGQSDSYNKNLGDIQYEMVNAGNALRGLARDERGWGNMDIKDIVDRIEKDPDSVPEFLWGAYDEYKARKQEFDNFSGGVRDEGQWPGGGK